jgi:polysaccharide export outer membrane protein
MVTQVNSALDATALQAPSPSDYRLGPEDLIEITLFNVESGTGLIPRIVQTRISQDSTITLALLGEVSVGGLTPSALEQLLRDRYNEYIYNPQVSVSVREYLSQQVSVLGAVRSPGVFRLTGPKTLGEVLSLAGGITAQAGSDVHVYRQGSDGGHTYVIDLLALASNPRQVNMPVQAGDVINVPLVGMFFVHGAVNGPGGYPLLRPYTLSEAIAMAGGLKIELSDQSNVAIFRRQGAQSPERIPVDLNAVLAGEAPDPQIKPADTIVVPIGTAKWFLDRFIGRIGLPGVPAPYPRPVW